MKTRRRLDLFAVSALAVLAAASLASCPDPEPADPVFPKEPTRPMPVVGNGLYYVETCETSTLGAEWLVYGTPDAAPERAGQVCWSGSFSRRFDSQPMWSGTSAGMRLTATLQGDTNLRFRLRTDIGGDQSGVDTWFLVLVDGVEKARYAGLGGAWETRDILVPSAPGATHEIDFRVWKGTGIYFVGPTNSVWLDDVTLCVDQVAGVDMEPDGPKKTFVGGDHVRFQAFATRTDGSAKTDAPVSYTVLSGPGSVDAEGRFSSASAGESVVRASAGGYFADSGTIKIGGADWIREPWISGGSTWLGMTHVLDPGSPLVSADPKILVTWPVAKKIAADGFFPLEGSVAYADDYQYVYVIVKKGTSQDHHFLRGSGGYRTRVWLRYGPGDYEVSVYKCRITSGNLGYEGDILGWAYSGPIYRFTVSNTRDEQGVFRYPSYYVQSDDLAIWNATQDVVAGVSGAYFRLKAIHDYVVRLLHYDYDSLVAGSRKKQDGVTVFTLGTGVCEGYASLYAAMARAAGYRVKSAAGDAGGGHAWNLYDYEGIPRMIDATWDDPSSDPLSRDVRWTYFLCPPDGVDGDHEWKDDRPSRGGICYRCLANLAPSPLPPVATGP